MPPKHNLNEDDSSTPEETPQKRRKHDNKISPHDVVEDMEETMRVINGVLPEEYNVLDGISKIPRGLLEPRISKDTVLAKLNTFKNFCQTTLEVISEELGASSFGNE